MNDLNRGIVLRFMREALAEFPTRLRPADTLPYYSRLMDATLSKLAGAGLVDAKYAGDTPFLVLGGEPCIGPLLVLLTESYQHLLVLGYIIPGPEPPRAPKRNFFLVTERGQRWARGSEPVPEDSHGYFEALNSAVPDLDPVIYQYVQEALIAYERQTFFAAAVMVGAASEKAIYLLVDTLHDALSDNSGREILKEAIDRRRLVTMLDLLRRILKRARSSGTMPYTVHEGTDTHLASLLESIRFQRNEAVHPTSGQVSAQMVRLALAAFPAACKKVYELIDWLTNNQVPWCGDREN